MGEIEDVERLRKDIAELYIKCTAYEVRLAKLEERSDNRDEKIDNLKKDIDELRSAIKGLEAVLQAELKVITSTLIDIKNKPMIEKGEESKKVWAQIKTIAITIVATALIAAAFSSIIKQVNETLNGKVGICYTTILTC